MDALSQIGRDPAARRKLALDWGIERFAFFDAIDSTQNVLRSMAESGAPGWSLAVADFQSSGRGQGGRRWHARPGGSLIFSLLLRLDTAAAGALLPIRAGLAVARALDPFLATGERIMLKWPNDLVIADGKLGGILCEGQVRGDEALVIVGVGINVEPFDPGPYPELDARRDLPVNFLGPALTPEATRLDLLDAIIRSLRAALPPKLSARESDAAMLDAEEMRDYAGRDWLRGRMLAEPIEGIARGISDEGLLKVEREDGSIEQAMSGRVVLQWE